MSRRRRSEVIAGLVLAGVALALVVAQLSQGSRSDDSTRDAGAAIVSVHEAERPRGVMVTSGGWAYCRQVQALARRTRFTLLCGRYPKDGYLARDLRAARHLDWGNAAYLRALATEARTLHARVGGDLLLLGVSYSGFGVATLASHHPELRPDRLVVIDSYLDLLARRAVAADGAIGREIDRETGGSRAALTMRNVSVERLAQLVEAGTELTVIWSIAGDEARRFKGATCNRDASAGVLQRLADRLGRPVSGWVTQNRHGHDLWDHGRRIVAGTMPGREVRFRPGGEVPADAVCP